MPILSDISGTKIALNGLLCSFFMKIIIFNEMRYKVKNKIKDLICEFVHVYSKKDNIKTKWGEPLVGFADAGHSYIKNFPQLITPSHQIPTDVLDDASIVIVYYVPFTKELAETNDTSSELASPDWALAYEETNAMFNELNTYIMDHLKKWGYNGGISPKSATFHKDILKSDWSYRHFAYAAGLGTFGVNNMIITKKGCCGRFSTVVTNLDVEPDQPVKDEYCLYKKDGSCGLCIKNCPAGALAVDSYNRNECYKILQKNAEVYTEFGSSYVDETGNSSNSIGSEVCGKCVTQSPCAFWALK